MNNTLINNPEFSSLKVFPLKINRQRWIYTTFNKISKNKYFQSYLNSSRK